MNNLKISLFLIASLVLPAKSFSRRISFVNGKTTFSIATDSEGSLAFFSMDDTVHITKIKHQEDPAVQPEIYFTRISFIATSSYIRSIFYDQNTKNLYLALGENGMEIWNVNNPLNPYKITHYNIGGFVRKIYVKGNYAYIADEDSGLCIFDITDPENPVKVSIYHTPGKANDVFLNENFAFLADGDSGLFIIDVSNPFNPEEIGHCAIQGYANSVYVEGKYAYVAEGDAGFSVIDLEDLHNPVEILHNSTYGYCTGAVPNNDYLYVIDGNITMYRIHHDNYSLEGIFDYSVDDTILTVTIYGDYLFVGDKNLGVIALKPVENHNALQEAGYYYATDSYIKGVFYNPDDVRIYAADYFYGLRVVISWDTVETSSLKLPGHPEDVYVQGNYAYIASGEAGLIIVNISNPDSLYVASSFPVQGYAKDVVVNGNYAFVATGGEGLTVVDIQDPNNPHKTGSCEVPGYASGIFLKDNYAYIAAGHGGLRIIDVSNPQDPQEISHIATPGYANKVSVPDTIAFIADGDSGICVINVSHPSQPEFLFSYTNGHYAVAVNAWRVTYHEYIVPTAHRDGEVALYSVQIIGENHHYVWSSWDAILQIVDVQDISTRKLDCCTGQVILGGGRDGIIISEYWMPQVNENPPSSNSDIRIRNRIVSKYIILYAPHENTETLHFSLFDASGRKIKSYDVKPSNGIVKLPVKDLTSGVYFLRADKGQMERILIKH